MCIIAAKPAGVDMPSTQYIENMIENNADGAGFMYAFDNKVYIEKGFMSKKQFMDRINSLGMEHDLKQLPLVMHFRITTHGGTKPENCHPFPVTDSMGMLKKLKCRTDIGVAHNGIISVTPRSKEISDTMEYIAGQLAPLRRAVRRFYTNKDLMQMIYHAIDSKMVIMDEAGNLYYIGDFKVENGVRYSNNTYKYSFRDFRYFPYSVDGYDIGEDEYTETKWLMWLDESKGEYIQMDDGEIYSGDDIAIDKKNETYFYDNDIGCFVKIWGATAYTAEKTPLRYNPKSLYISREIILKDEYV